VFQAPADELIASPPASGSGGGFTAPSDEIISGDYWGDVKKNAIAGAKQWPAAAETMGGQALKIGRAMMPGQVMQSGVEALQGKPLGETPVGEGAKALYDVGKGALHGAWQGVKDTGSAIKAPFEMMGGEDLAQTDIGQKFRERPLSVPAGVAGTVLPAVSAFKALRGAGAAAEEGAGLAGEAGAAAEEGAGAIPKPPPVGEAPPLGSVPPEPPPVGAAPKPNPLQEVSDYVANKYGKVSSKPGFTEGIGRYLQDASQKMGGKDIGIQPRQIQSMGQGFKGLEKAEALVDYAREKGYLDPGLTDIARKAAIKQNMKQAGQQLEAVRAISDTRGAPPIAEIRNQLQTQLTADFGIDAPNEINKVLQKFDKAAKENPTFSGMADLASELNKSKTPAKSMGQHPGPTTDGANIVSQMTNDAARKLLNPQEQKLYTDSLRDFGAHKKLEQAVAASGRRELSARTNQRGLVGRLFQEALDRGGYRVAGNVANRLGKSMVESPAKVKTLPQFFEELAHHTDDVMDEALDIQGMAHGGIVGEVGAHLESKYGAR